MRSLAAAALVALTLAARAEALTLDEAQAEARRSAPDARLLEARLEGAARIARDARRLLRSDPRFTATLAPRGVAGADERAVTLGLELPLEVSGAQALRGASADADRDRARLEREDGLRALDEAVAIAFADLVLAQAAAARADRIATLHERIAGAARRELELGRGNRLDGDGADLDLAVARADAAEVRAAVRRGQAELSRLLGRSSPAGLEVTPASPDVVAPPRDAPEGIADHDPRVAAARAELEAARLGLAAEERSIVPRLNLGVEWSKRERSIPSGAFSGGPPGLSAGWNERELAFVVGFDLPVLDRRTGPRAAASGRIGVAEAQLARARAAVVAEVAGAAAELEGAIDARRAVAGVPEAVRRDLELLERAVAAGALDAVARAQAIRRLQDAAARAERADHALAVAVARWRRVTAVTSG